MSRRKPRYTVTVEVKDQDGRLLQRQVEQPAGWMFLQTAKGRLFCTTDATPADQDGLFQRLQEAMADDV